MIREGLKSFYRSGAWFSQDFLPRAFGKTGLRAKNATMLGRACGVTLGLASLAVGLGFCAALPVSLPMFMVASAIMPVSGKLMALGAAAVLAGTGTVVTITGCGMCRDLKDAARALLRKAHAAPLHPGSPASPEKSFFKNRRFASAFKKATANPPISPTPAAAITPRPGLTLSS